MSTSKASEVRPPGSLDPMMGKGNVYRNEEGFYISKEQVNTFWRQRYGHPCPYMEPQPTQQYLKLKEAQRRKKAADKRKFSALLNTSGKGLGTSSSRPQTRAGTAASTGGRQQQGSPVRTAPISRSGTVGGVQSSASANKLPHPPPPRHYVGAQLMPPPGQTGVKAPGVRRQRAVAGGGRSRRDVEGEDDEAKQALVMKRLQEAIMYSEVYLPKLYGSGSSVNDQATVGSGTAAESTSLREAVKVQEVQLGEEQQVAAAPSPPPPPSSAATQELLPADTTIKSSPKAAVATAASESAPVLDSTQEWSGEAPSGEEPSAASAATAELSVEPAPQSPPAAKGADVVKRSISADPPAPSRSDSGLRSRGHVRGASEKNLSLSSTQGGAMGGSGRALLRRAQTDVRPDEEVTEKLSQSLRAIKEGQHKLRPAKGQDAAEAHVGDEEKRRLEEDKVEKDREKSHAALEHLRDWLKESGLMISEALPHLQQDPVGRGRKAVVYTGSWEADGADAKRVAMKEFTFDSRRLSLPPLTVIESFKQELLWLRKVQHPNVVSLLGAQVSPKLCIVTELAQESLGDRIKNKATWVDVPLEERMKILEDVLRGMIALHAVNLVHRDIKSHNVLIEPSTTPHRMYCAKVADLGSAGALGPDGYVQEEVGTSGWMAPEVLAGEGYDSKADVFSFGMLMWEVLAGTTSNPLTSLDLGRLKAELELVQEGGKCKLPLPEGLPKALVSLQRDCLLAEPMLRPGAAEVFQRLTQVIESLAIGEATLRLQSMPSTIEESRSEQASDAGVEGLLQSEQGEPAVVGDALVSQAASFEQPGKVLERVVSAGSAEGDEYGGDLEWV